jgi:hypothetical protein
VPTAPWLLVAGFTAWILLSAVILPLSMLLSAAHLMRGQVIAGLLMAAVNLPLSIWLTHTVGVAGPILATVICQLVITVPAYLLLSRRLFSQDGQMTAARLSRLMPPTLTRDPGES